MLSLDKAFGYLGQKPGYCANGKCHVFPIAVGEFGSRFTNPEDLAHLADLALYMNAEGIGNTGGHKAFSNWFYCKSESALTREPWFLYLAPCSDRMTCIWPRTGSQLGMAVLLQPVAFIPTALD